MTDHQLSEATEHYDFRFVMPKRGDSELMMQFDDDAPVSIPIGDCNTLTIQVNIPEPGNEDIESNSITFKDGDSGKKLKLWVRLTGDDNSEESKP